MRIPVNHGCSDGATGAGFSITERRTGNGGTVAVFSDITELKQREEQLTEKSNALQQLSTQLAKYLSPQVYDSIFSGKQEVKLVSQRKRLTVFFSDIARFTETTERLESEDLTHLLNHYLTEMSQIALAHGATIDKYVGDAILIFFGDPETRGVKEDAARLRQDGPRDAQADDGASRHLEGSGHRGAAALPNGDQHRCVHGRQLRQ